MRRRRTCPGAIAAAATQILARGDVEQACDELPCAAGILVDSRGRAALPAVE